MSEHTLVVSDVSKTIAGDTVLTDVSATIESTERVAIIGPSGAGKTTFLRLLAGAIHPDSGTIEIDGDPVSRGAVAMAYQGDALVRSRTALQNVIAGQLGSMPWWRGLLDPVFRPGAPSAQEALAAVGLEDKTGQRVDELSAGERGRVAVAQALVQSGTALVADEPTANLDRTTQEQVLDVLETAGADRLFLVVLHDVSVATERFDRILGFRDGRLQLDSPAADVSEARLARLFEGGTAETERDRPAGPDHDSPEVAPVWYA